MRSRACYLYVLPLAYEDILKLGISHDPLVRAQARETELHRQLRDWNAVQPITVPGAAAGKTEWYRGAHATLLKAFEKDLTEGRVVHVPALEWWRTRLLNERKTLYEWASMVMRLDGTHESKDKQNYLDDALGAHPALRVLLDNCLPQSPISGIT